MYEDYKSLTAVNAQHPPQTPWFLILVTTPLRVQSISIELSAETIPLKLRGLIFWELLVLIVELTKLLTAKVGTCNVKNIAEN